MLTSTMPSCLVNIKLMSNMFLYHNHFTGTIPATWASLRNLTFLDIGSNHLTGSLPAFIGSMPLLRYLYVNANLLIGTVPTELGNASSLTEILLENNNFSGTLPGSFVNLHHIQILDVRNNLFVGNLEEIFADHQSHVNLTTLQLYDNQFTGSLPEALFRRPKLGVLVAGTNCLEGYFPPTLCDCTTLTTLSLDGMSSAKACRSVFLPGVSSWYTEKGIVSQPLPPCLFQLPILKTLHLSGNGFTGTLPASSTAPLGPLLEDLGLSHNQLTGTIPQQYQQRRWVALDMSFNRLTGTLHSDFNISASTDSTLSLVDNRLSGRIPGSFHNMINISVLGSNLFSCNLQHSNLPRHDNGAEKYDCGSTTFDVPYFAWLLLAGVGLAAPGVAWWVYRDHPRVMRTTASIQHWLGAVNGESGIPMLDGQLPNLVLLSKIYRLLCWCSCLCLCYILAVLLPIYAALNALYGTYTHTYTYRASAAFLAGEKAGIVEFVFLLILLFLFVTVFVHKLRYFSIVESRIRLDSIMSRKMSAHALGKPSHQDQSASTWEWMRNFTAYCVFFLLSTTVVAGVNVAYVYIAIYQGAHLLLFAQIAIAAFKVVWGGVGARALFEWTLSNMVVRDESQTETGVIMLQVLNALLNNIIVPCVVVGVVSPSCFYNVFALAPKVTTSFTYPICGGYIAGHCTEIVPAHSTTSYQPAFAYSYQCSSSIVTYYAPVFVALCIITSFVVPVLELVLFRHFSGRSSSEPQSTWCSSVQLLLPPILRHFNSSRPDASVERLVQFNRPVVMLISCLGILLTFGAVFPPLAAALVVTLLVVSYFTKLKVGWFLCTASSQKRVDAVQAVEAECQRAGAVEVMRRSAWLLVGISCLFYALFIFDTIGDKEGFAGAYWVLIVLPLMPAVIFACYNAFLYVYREVESHRQESSQVEGDVEMDAVLWAPPSQSGGEGEGQSDVGKSSEEGELSTTVQSALHPS